ncbi:MAG: hypothetical protein Q9226_008108 [Calogaya cf. arnoldii]
MAIVIAKEVALARSDILAFGLLLWVVYIAIRRLWNNRQFQAFAREHKCEIPPHTANTLPWGIDRMWRMVQLTSQGADVMESVIMPSFRSTGWTFQSSGLFGAEPLFISDPENLRAVFATHFSDYGVESLRLGAFGFMVGKCIFTTDGPFWEHSRSLFRPHFSTGQLGNLGATEKAVRDLLTAIPAQNSQSWTEEFDLQPLFLRFTLDSGTDFLFGVNVNSQLGAIPGSLQDDDTVNQVTSVAADAVGGEMNFSEAFHLASIEVTKRAKLQSLYWLANSKKAQRAVAYLQTFIDHLATTNKPAPEEKTDEDGSEGKFTLLTALAKDTHNPIELRDQVLFALVASRDTTAAMLSWMFLMLAKHPFIFQHLRSAILTDFGSSSSGGTKPITINSLKKCQYLQHVMLETLRLYPPGPLNSRVAVRDTVLPTGGGEDGKSPVAVRKGTVLNLCVYATQRRADIWGDDVLEFRPERWMNRRRSDWTFLPFSGEQYALTIAGYLTVRLLQQFDAIEAVDDLSKIPQFVTVTLEAKNGVKVKLRKAAS